MVLSSILQTKRKKKNIRQAYIANIVIYIHCTCTHYSLSKSGDVSYDTFNTIEKMEKFRTIQMGKIKTLAYLKEYIPAQEKGEISTRGAYDKNCLSLGLLIVQKRTQEHQFHIIDNYSCSTLFFIGSFSGHVNFFNFYAFLWQFQKKEKSLGNVLARNCLLFIHSNSCNSDTFTLQMQPLCEIYLYKDPSGKFHRARRARQLHEGPVSGKIDLRNIHIVRMKGQLYCHQALFEQQV